MYIISYTNTNKKTGKIYTYHAVKSGVRTGSKTKGVTVLQLWKGFDAPKELWPLIMYRVDSILARQGPLWPCSQEVEECAQRIAAAILEKREAKAKEPPKPLPPATEPTDKGPALHDGAAQAAFFAMRRIGLESMLHRLLGGDDKAKVAMCLIAARMQRPLSEMEKTYSWLCRWACPLGPLAGLDFQRRSEMELHHTSDMLLSFKDIIVSELNQAHNSLLNQKALFIFYDQTSFFFEGSQESPMSKRGRSKEKRSDRSLMSVAILADDKNDIIRFRFHLGKVIETKTLLEIVQSMKIDTDTIIIMDKGIATEEIVERLNEHGYKYIVASRKGRSPFDQDKATDTFESNAGHCVSLYKELETTAMGADKMPVTEAFVRWRSSARGARYSDITDKRRNGNEYGLRALDNRCGRAVAKGAYDLRTNVLTMEGKEIWHAHARLTSVESAFRSLKPDLGLRPDYHSDERRSLGHAFISDLARRAINWIRSKLKANGINHSWNTIVDCLMDVNCEKALGAAADAAEEAGLLYPEVAQARGYFKAIGLDKPAPLTRPLDPVRL